MPTLSSKIFEVFKFNLKSDAIPKSPRSSKTKNETGDADCEENLGNDENVDTSNLPGDSYWEPKEEKGKNIPKTNKKGKKQQSKSPDNESHMYGNNVNTQATGQVINIVGSNDVHWGHIFINQVGTGSSLGSKPNVAPDFNIKKCKLIEQVMEAKIKLDNEHIQYTSENLGKNWCSFFRKLGYTQGRIETFEIDTAKHGVAEARYKLLLDWKRNDDDASLGHLAKLLWDHGERQVVKGLALIYQKSKK